MLVEVWGSLRDQNLPEGYRAHSLPRKGAMSKKAGARVYRAKIFLK